MKRLRRGHKSLFVLEAGYVWCLRRGIEYSDDSFMDEHFLTGDFDCEEGSEYDRIIDDLRAFRYIKGYELREITVEEYESCIEEFGHDEKWIG
jgi:hypothetical protein